MRYDLISRYPTVFLKLREINFNITIMEGYLKKANTNYNQLKISKSKYYVGYPITYSIL